jgi:hypothetical protein
MCGTSSQRKDTTETQRPRVAAYSLCLRGEMLGLIQGWVFETTIEKRAKNVLELLPPVEEARFHRAHRAINDLGDFLDRVPLHVMQTDDDALLICHTAERLFDE